MNRWTEILESQQPVRRSIDHTAKVFVVNAQGNFLLVKQEICEDEDSAEKVKQRAMQMTHRHVCAATAITSEKRLGGGVYAYVVMPLLSRSLQDDLSHRTSHYPEEQLWRYLGRLIDALATLQQQGIAHGDIQPKNLLLDNEGEIYVCDFGVGRRFELDADTRKAMILSVPFLSPKVRSELLKGKFLLSSFEHNPYKSDVYSLGMTLLNLTLLELPHYLARGTPTERTDLQHNLTKLLTKNSFYSQKWMEVLHWMLIVQEEARPDFLELQSGLQQDLVYKDDDIIEISTEERESELSVSVYCGLRAVRVNPRVFEEVPCMVSLKASEMKKTRYSVDLVCVLDVSGSMEGTRLHTVQTALSAFINSLSNTDRMCLITFSDTAERHCPLVACTDEGKVLLERLVAGLCAHDLTNVTAGFKLAINVLMNRRIKAPAASILLLTDGKHTVEDYPKEMCLDFLQQSGLEKLNVHCFAFYADLDAIFLRNLTRKGSGTFHYVSEAKELEEAFFTCFNFLTRIVVRNVHVSLQLISENCERIRIFSEDSEREFPALEVSMPDIEEKQSKDLVFVLYSKLADIPSAFRTEVLEVVVTYKDYDGVDRETRKKLEVKFIPWSDATPVKVKTVFANWERAKGIIVLRSAEKLADAANFNEATKVLENGIEAIVASGYSENVIVQPILRDLQLFIPLVQNESTYRQGGSAMLSAHLYSHQAQSVSIRVKEVLETRLKKHQS